MSKQKYYDLTRIKENMAKMNFLLGERSNGKSYAVKYYALKKAFDLKLCCIGLVWRYDQDIKQEYITSYFADMPINEITDGVYDGVTAYHGSIYFTKLDVESDKEEKGLCIGKYFALNIATRYKSKAYPDITDIIFEEFMSSRKKPYLQDEVSDFLQLMSTIFRRRSNCRIWFIGNTISRVCPYFNEMLGQKNAKTVLNMKAGDLNIFEMESSDGSKTKIAIEYCENSTGGSRTGLFFGKYEKNIEQGQWETDEHPKLLTPFKECEVVYQLTLKQGDFAFNVCLLFQADENPYIYVYPCKSESYKERIITEEFANSELVDNQLHTNTNKAESLIHRQWLLGKVCYSDNLTAEDFLNTLKLFKKMPL